MTYSVDDDGRKHSRRNGRPVFGIFLAANELRVVALEEKAEHRQNDDRKNGNDEATNVSARVQVRPSNPTPGRRHPPRPGLHRAHNRLHLGRQKQSLARSNSSAREGR